MIDLAPLIETGTSIGLGERSGFADPAASAAGAKPHSQAENAYIALRRENPDQSEDEQRHASGLDVAEAAYRAADDASLAIIHEIAQRPARTIEGLALKAFVLAHEYHRIPDLVEAVMADILAMVGVERKLGRA